ncbi:MAG: hypothetical protein AABZ53_16265 [Planctomycetota bacterium]
MHPPPATPATSLDSLLDTPLLALDGNLWTIRDAVEGTQVFGGNGSGKSSGSGRTIAEAFVRHGFGGLVLTAKPDDLQQWVGYLESAGLGPADIAQRLLVVEPPDRPSPPVHTKDGQPLTLPTCRAFNFLTYEFDRCGHLTTDVVSLFINAMSPGSSSVSGTEPYWNDALQQLFTHAVDLATLAAEAETGTPTLRLRTVMDIISSAPQSPLEAASSGWRNTGRSACWRCIDLVAEKLVRTGHLVGGRLSDFSRCLDYWTLEFPALSDRTRSVIVSSLTSKAAGLLHSPMEELLCGEDDPLTSPAAPEETFRGRIVVLNLPVKLFGEVGRFGQTLWKTVWQRAVDRRTGKVMMAAGQRPVFLWCDESQYFVTKEDVGFQQTARGSLAATVYLTQNLSNYYAAIGGALSKAATDSLVGNLQTKIFHALGDPATVEWAERLYGKTVRAMSSRSQNLSTRDDSIGRGASSTLIPVVEAHHFASLRTGGPVNNYQVDAWIYKAGKPWRQSATTAEALGYPEVPPHILRCTFRQETQ